MNIFSEGNSKAGPEVVAFNLPPISTCTPSRWCRDYCYALTGNHRFPSVKKSWEKRLELSQRPDFADLAIEELKKKKIHYVRPHLAGDFYNTDYVKKWIEIGKQCPEILFRTTTKRIDLGKTLKELDSLPNFIVRESLDISRPIPSGLLPLIIVIKGVEINQNLFFCINDCKKCDYTCWKRRISTLVEIIPKH